MVQQSRDLSGLVTDLHHRFEGRIAGISSEIAAVSTIAQANKERVDALTDDVTTIRDDIWDAPASAFVEATARQ